ncbi:MAG TPA: OB-fold domain-containing protein [Dehalococcoidia bacterium]|nr:OB-fold domain-containing protein [Dehalococcoidia bacterium]
MPKPVPVPDALSKPFWDAVQERRLVLQTCTACNRKQYPPEPRCAACGSAEHLEWREVRGRGRIYGYCVMYDSRLIPLHEDQPFNIAVIKLEEDPEIMFFSHLPGTPPDQVPVGATVEIYFEELKLEPGRLIHEWKIVQ